MAGLRPRDRPEGNGPDGPSGRIIDVSAAQGDIRDRLSVVPTSQTQRRKNKGKEIDRSEPVQVDYSQPFSNTREGAVRDMAKVRAIAGGSVKPTVEYYPRAPGLCNSKGDARRWNPPSTCVPSSGERSDVSSSIPPTSRLGRWIKDLPPEPASCKAARQLAELRMQGGHLPDEHGPIRDHEDVGTSSCKVDEAVREEPESVEEEDSTFQINVFCSSLSISALTVYVEF